jgi:hypothetical protein
MDTSKSGLVVVVRDELAELMAQPPLKFRPLVRTPDK